MAKNWCVSLGAMSLVLFLFSGISGLFAHDPEVPSHLYFARLEFPSGHQSNLKSIDIEVERMDEGAVLYYAYVTDSKGNRDVLPIKKVNSAPFSLAQTLTVFHLTLECESTL